MPGPLGTIPNTPQRALWLPMGQNEILLSSNDEQSLAPRPPRFDEGRPPKKGDCELQNDMTRAAGRGCRGLSKVVRLAKVIL